MRQVASLNHLTDARFEIICNFETTDCFKRNPFSALNDI